MNELVPLLVALFGAGFGAYFAVLKSRKERLWVDRYEALRETVVSLETIQAYFESAHMQFFGADALSAEEAEKLKGEWPKAKHELRSNIAKMRLLFKDKQIEVLIEQHRALSSAFFDLYNDVLPENPDNIEAITKRAEEAINEAIRVAQKYCL